MALSGKKLLLLGFVVVLMVVIPLTVYLVQQQQKLKVGATPATTLSLIDEATKTAAASTTTGQNVKFDVIINPGGTNQISFVKLSITYDSTKLATEGAGLAPDTTRFPTTLQGPTYSPGKAEITLSVGSNPQNILSGSTPITVATLTLKALDVTTTPTPIRFDPATQVLSIASSDQFNENVLSSSIPGTVTISQGTATPTPSVSPTPTPSGSASPTSSPTPGASTTPTPAGGTSGGGTGGASATPCPAGSSTCQVATVPSPTASASATPFSTPTPTPVPTPVPTLAPTGPGNTIFSFGTLGIVSAIAGVILLFAL